MLIYYCMIILDKIHHSLIGHVDESNLFFLFNLRENFYLGFGNKIYPEVREFSKFNSEGLQLSICPI